MNGNQLKDNARKELNALRAKYNQQMEAAGYTYFAGGDSDLQWAAWVYKDYALAVEGQLQHYSSIDENRIAKYLGVGTLPEGAIVDVTYLF
jgi:hypothetical protein